MSMRPAPQAQQGQVPVRVKVYTPWQIQSSGCKRMRGKIAELWRVGFAKHALTVQDGIRFLTSGQLDGHLVVALAPGDDEVVAVAHARSNAPEASEYIDARAIGQSTAGWWDFLYLSRVAVAPLYRGRGVMGQLIEATAAVLGAQSALHPGFRLPLVLDVDAEDVALLAPKYARYGFRVMCHRGEGRALEDYFGVVHKMHHGREVRFVRWDAGAEQEMRRLLWAQHALPSGLR